MNELIVKSNEIKRLHKVCNAKDDIIKTLLEHFQYHIDLMDIDGNKLITPQYRKQINNIIINAKNSLG